jgi:hypothetical protein
MDNCKTDEDCGGGDSICCNFYDQVLMCMPESMCPGTPGGCTENTDCTVEGQVCCKFGDMAETPTCVAEGMCPKVCTTNEDCPDTQECCDLNETVVCLDIGQCPQKCFHSSSECPDGLECCDSGDGLLICISDAECPGSVSCTDASYVCKNGSGEPNGETCCEVPDLGFRCVGSAGCDNWTTCVTNEDCPTGRECCQLMDGLTCVPTGACPL